MNDKFNHIDNFFEKKIGASEMGPPQQGWDRLAASIEDQRSKPSFLVWRRWFTSLVIFSFNLSLAVILWGDQQARQADNANHLISENSTSKSHLNTEEQNKINLSNNFFPIEHNKTIVSSKANKTFKSSNLSIENANLKTSKNTNTHDLAFSSPLRHTTLETEKVPGTTSVNAPQTILNSNKRIGNPLASLSHLLLIDIDPLLQPRGFSPLLFPEKLKKRKDKFRQIPLSWSLSVYSTTGIIQSTISTQNSELFPLTKKIREGLSNEKFSERGLRLSAHFKHLYLGTGVSFSEINQQVFYSFPQTIMDTVDFWIHYTYWQTIHDTIDWYCQVGTDTTWIPIIEDTQEEALDSLPATRIDTINTTLDTLLRNRFNYVEIPLIVGYTFYKGRYSITLKSGIITGILQTVSAQTLSGVTPDKIYSVRKPDMPVFTFDVYSGIETRYFFGSRYFVFGDVFIRKPVTTFYSAHDINRKLSRYGLKLGIGIHF